MFDDIYPTKYIGKTTINYYDWEDEISGRTKLVVLSQNLCMLHASRESKIELLILVSDFMENFGLHEKYSIAFLWNSWNVLMRM